ncbi:MAG: branched-chain amino acid ABC transporter substrate-binding protein [Candidatus Acidiferrales bacterium]
MARKATVTIGIAAPFSCEAKLLGREMKQAIELAIDEVNSQGGILGQEILTFALDDQSEVERGLGVAEEFARRPDVLAVIGHYSSDVTIAAADVYHQASLAVVAPIASNPDLTEKRLPNVFRFTNRDDETGLAIAQFLYRELGKRRAVLVESATAYGRSMAQQFGDAFQRLGGEIVYRQIVQSGARSFDGLIRSLPKDFDVVFYGGSFEGAYILRSMRSEGHGQRFAAGDGCWDKSNFLIPAGNALLQGEGVLVLSATPEIGLVPGSSEFAKKYSQRFGPITNYAVNSYDATRFVLNAISQIETETGQKPNRSAVPMAIRSAKYRGIAYPQQVHWNVQGDNLASLTALYEVTDGDFHQVAEVPRRGANI